MYLVYVQKSQSSLAHIQVSLEQTLRATATIRLFFTTSTQNKKKKRKVSHVLLLSIVVCILSDSRLIISESIHHIRHRYNYAALGSTHPK
jgi:hypothetical protein